MPRQGGGAGRGRGHGHGVLHARETSPPITAASRCAGRRVRGHPEFRYGSPVLDSSTHTELEFAGRQAGCRGWCSSGRDGCPLPGAPCPMAGAKTRSGGAGPRRDHGAEGGVAGAAECTEALTDCAAARDAVAVRVAPRPVFLAGRRAAGRTEAPPLFASDRVHGWGGARPAWRGARAPAAGGLRVVWQLAAGPTRWRRFGSWPTGWRGAGIRWRRCTGGRRDDWLLSSTTCRPGDRGGGTLTGGGRGDHQPVRVLAGGRRSRCRADREGGGVPADPTGATGPQRSRRRVSWPPSWGCRAGQAARTCRRRPASSVSGLFRRGGLKLAGARWPAWAAGLCRTQRSGAGLLRLVACCAAEASPRPAAAAPAGLEFGARWPV